MLVVSWRVNKIMVHLRACHQQPTLQSLSAAVHAVPIMTLLTNLLIWRNLKFLTCMATRSHSPDRFKPTGPTAPWSPWRQHLLRGKSVPATFATGQRLCTTQLVVEEVWPHFSRGHQWGHYHMWSDDLATATARHHCSWLFRTDYWWSLTSHTMSKCVLQSVG